MLHNLTVQVGRRNFVRKINLELHRLGRKRKLRDWEPSVTSSQYARPSGINLNLDLIYIIGVSYVACPDLRRTSALAPNAGRDRSRGRNCHGRGLSTQTTARTLPTHTIDRAKLTDMDGGCSARSRLCLGL